jgi:four helix bundle protein
MQTYTGHKALDVWKVSYALTKEIYRLTARFPKDETYGLSSQMKRAAVSIISNIAEGYRRKSNGSNMQFALIAYGSAAELEAQLELSKDLKMTEHHYFAEAESLMQRALQLLNRYCNYLQKQRRNDARRNDAT